jgi:NADPH:quinone reductase-like Zn-dependent oxidoreductase
MKAIVNAKYGSPDILQLKEVNKPVPGDNEVLVKVHAASINAFDWHILRGKPSVARLFIGLNKPRYQILGADIAGIIESTGKDVKQLQPGDEVFGDLATSGAGGFAEYVCASENLLVLKPASITFGEAAAIPMAGMTALQALRDKGKIKEGKKVLINGAGGGVGMFAVQIAKSFGAEVTAVCGAGNLEMVRTLGADHVIDYTKEDFTKSSQQYDLILGANGYHSLSDYKRALRPNGIYVMTGGSNAQMFEALLLGPWMSIFGNKKMCSTTAKASLKDLDFIIGLIEAGKVKPVIDRWYKLSQVAEGIRYLEEGHARGKVVINIV